MPRTLQPGDTFTLADAHLRALCVVADFIGSSVQPVAKRAIEEGNDAHETYFAYLMRVVAWLATLRKLNHPGDFQAAAAGSRSLFEITIDLTLLHHEPAYTVEHIRAWEESSKYKTCEAALSVLKGRTDQSAIDHAAIYRTFVERHKADMPVLRQRMWGKPTHPNRWTGNNLFDDALNCDRLAESRYGEYYRRRYPELCWNTHGSAFVSLRHLSEDLFPGLCAQAFSDAAAFASTAAELVLRLLECFDPITEVRFERLRPEINAAYGAALAQRSDWPPRAT